MLKNSTDDTSKLILYKTKEQILSTLLLTKSSQDVVTVYWKPPYLQFHDDSNGFWSLLFGSDADSNEFFAKLEEACTIDRAIMAKPDGIISKENDNIEKISSKPTETSKLSNDKVDEPDTISNPTVKAKSDVVYRVAKIGHQLPRIKPVADDDSDSTSDTGRLMNTPLIKSVYNIPEKPATFQIPPKPANISVALQPSIWPSSTFDLNSFAAENRMQHTEVRMNLSKLDSKMDRVLDNIERKYCLIEYMYSYKREFILTILIAGLRLGSLNPTDVPDKEEEIIKLEEKVLELKKENRLLKLQLSESDQAKRDNNEKEKEDLIILQKTNNEREHKITELTRNLQELEQKLSTEFETKEKEKAELTEKYTVEMENLHEELEKKKVELEEAQQQKSNKTGDANNGEMIRGIMNQFYVKLYQSIEGKETMASGDILKLTAEIIRKETKAALNSN